MGMSEAASAAAPEGDKHGHKVRGGSDRTYRRSEVTVKGLTWRSGGAEPLRSGPQASPCRVFHSPGLVS